MKHYTKHKPLFCHKWSLLPHTIFISFFIIIFTLITLYILIIIHIYKLYSLIIFPQETSLVVHTSTNRNSIEPCLSVIHYFRRRLFISKEKREWKDDRQRRPFVFHLFLTPDRVVPIPANEHVMTRFSRGAQLK